ncbi:MAG: hypothetical protein K1X94_30905 [Sandaracinaceae bacterium]|nr:hypothetical protein [Sandaracinaceae bacterium]
MSDRPPHEGPSDRAPDEIEPTLARARRAYELARLRRALVHALPSLALFVVLMLEGGARDTTGLVASLALYPTTVLALHLGQGAGAAALPALLFGLVPFVIVRVAESSGHVCLGEACVSWCLPACVIGGLAGGALVGARGRRERDRLGYALAAITLVVLEGAVGCRCAGHAGLAGIVLGTLAGTTVPWLAWRTPPVS